jgi:hypothetical protein
MLDVTINAIRMVCSAVVERIVVYLSSPCQISVDLRREVVP